MSNATTGPEQNAAATMPRGVKRALVAVTCLLIAGAALLMTTRGEALLIDLYATAKLLLCF